MKSLKKDRCLADTTVLNHLEEVGADDLACPVCGEWQQAHDALHSHIVLNHLRLPPTFQISAFDSVDPSKQQRLAEKWLARHGPPGSSGAMGKAGQASSTRGLTEEKDQHRQ